MSLDWQAWDILAVFIIEHQEELAVTAGEFGHDDESADAIAKQLLDWVIENEPDPRE